MLNSEDTKKKKETKEKVQLTVEERKKQKQDNKA